MTIPTNNLPLDRIKILDLTRLLPGPFATQYLGDLGAEILRVESPTPDLARLSPPYIMDHGTFDLSLNRNKKSIGLNLKTEKGRLIFYQIVKDYDVIIEQFRPGVVKKLEIDYESIKIIKPDIIYCSLSGYGQTGPYRDKPAHDINYLSEAGFLNDQLLNKSEHPFILPQVPIADLAGSFSTVIAILSAIIQKKNTGMGQYLDVSMFESVVSWLNGSLITLSALNKEVNSSDYMLNGMKPYYRTYDTADVPISIGALEPHFWQEFCLKLNLPEYINEQQNEDLHHEMTDKIESILKGQSCSHWLIELKNICVAPIKPLSHLAANVQLKQRNMLVPMEFEEEKRLNVINNPLFNTTENLDYFKRPPNSGEHTLEILQSLSYSEEEIKALKDENVIF